MLDDADLARLTRACADPLPHPSVDELQSAANRILQWALDDFQHLPERPIGVDARRAELERRLREPPPEVGRDWQTVLANFEAHIAPFAFRPQHPRFWAFIPGAPTFVSVLGDWLCSAANYFAGVWLEASAPAQIELLVLDWFKQFLHYPPEARGLITSGGSEANLTALVVAREPLPFDQRARACLYCSEQRHWSIDRAAKILGLRPDQVRPLPVDADWKLSPSRLEAAIAADRHAGLVPWAVIANAGATNTGTIDPLADLAEVCRRERLWLHVDAAYGWSAALTDAGQRLLAGIDHADSITLDPHKWFAQTFEAGCVLIRDGQRLPAAFAMRPDYLQDVLPEQEEPNFADHGIALTRRFRALKIWFSLQILGVSWFRQLVEHDGRLAELAQARLERTPGFEIVPPRQLSIVCFRYHPPGIDSPEELDRLNLALVEAVRLTGQAFLSSTRLLGRVVLRFCFVNWRTTSADVEQVVRLLADLSSQIPRPEAPG